MQMTPMEIRRQTFTKGFKGYAPEEVDHFVQNVAARFEELLAEKDRLVSEVAEQKTSLEKYLRLESTMQEMLLQSQKNVEESRSATEREASIIMKEAEIKADEIKKSAEKELEEIKRSIMVLRDQKRIYLTKFRTLIKSQIEMLQLLESGEPSGPRKPRTADDSAVARPDEPLSAFSA